MSETLVSKTRGGKRFEEENGPKEKTGLKEGEGPKFEEAEASEKEALLRIKKGYESDVEDEVMYEVDSDDEIVWRLKDIY